MTRVEFTLQGRSGSRRDLLVEGQGAGTWGGALHELLDGHSDLFVGQQPVPPQAELASGLIRTGDVVQVGTPGGGRAAWPRTGLLLAILAGPDAGHLWPLADGATLIGRDPGAGIVLADPSVSTQHARIDVHAGTVTLTDLGSTNGTWTDLDRLPANKPTPWAAGTRLVLGDVPVQLLGPANPDGTVLIDPDGSRQFNRVTRYLPTPPADRITLATANGDTDSEPSSSWVQYVTSAAMLAAGVTSAFMFHNMLYAVLGVLAPAATMAATFATHAATRRRHRRQRRQQADERTASLQAAHTAASAQADHAWQVTLDQARVALAMLGPTRDLWSTDATAEHAVTVRLGTREVPSTVLTGPTNDQAPVLRSVPILLDLRTTPVLGLAGQATHTAGLVRALLLQLAATRSPADLAIVHIAEQANAHTWSWLRWLPHTHTLLGTTATVSPTNEAANLRLGELSALIAQRQLLTTTAGPAQTLTPQVVVVLDGAGALRRNSAVVGLLQDGPAVGVYTIAVDDRASLLPAEATARLVLQPDRGTLEVHSAAPVDHILFDQTSPDLAEACARAVADLTPLGGDQTTLPEQVRLVELLDMQPLDAHAILTGWHQGHEGQAVLGVDENGRTSVVDLVRHGPHAVIAGATGAGKSELLRTLLVGLALSSPPDELNFLLIDFKGGGAFGKLTDLPHVVGYADDSTIAGVLAQRLLDSLQAELDRRKELLRQAGNAEDLTAYRKARQRTRDLDPIARLVIVVDEFAELRQAQPDFIDGLIQVARIGRSLGVHLVLATQQPNQITSQIRDNANLRICLRVLDPAASLDLVGSQVAAYFPNRIKGRAVWAGGDSAATVIQTARVSTARIDPNAPIPIPTLALLPWAACGLNGHTVPRAEDGATDTDMTALVAAVREVADAEGLLTTHQPWVPPVPDRIQMVTSAAAAPTAVTFGIQDRPSHQRHEPLTFDLSRGNLGIIGGHGSGRSTALRTLAGALAGQWSADDLHLYVIDHQPAAALRALGRLPHCGVVVTRTDRFATGRLVTRLRAEQQSRTELLARAGAASFTELRTSGPDAPPWIVVLIDGWEAIDDDNVRTDLLQLAEDGPAVGIALVVAAATDPHRLYTTFTDVLVLRFDQRDTMANFGVPLARVPATLPPGRAFRPGSADAIQIALLPADPSPDAQNAAITTLAASLPAPAHHQPLRIVELPRRIDLSDPRLGEHLAYLTDRHVMLGVGGDDASPRTLDLDRNRLLVVGGGPGTGRTQALVTLATQLAAHGIGVHAWHVREDDQARFPRTARFDDLNPPADAVVLVDDAHLLPATDEALTQAVGRADLGLVLAGEAAGLLGMLGWKARLAGATTVLLSPRSVDLAAMTVAATPFTAGPGAAYLTHRGRTERLQLLCTT